MPAPRLLEAVHERLLARFQEEHLEVEAVVVELAEDRLKLVEVAAAANVGHHRRVAHHRPLVAEELAQGADHPGRQVVDAEKARVLEGRDCLRLAGSRVAGDHPELDRLQKQLGLRLHPDLLSWRWMSRAILPGMPGTDSISSRVAATIRSGEPKWLSRARLR